MSSPDRLYRFLFEHSNVRGEIVQLDDTYRTVLARRSYPPLLRQLIGQALAATALLTATLKFKGSLSLQLQGKGPLTLLLVQAASDGGLRALAQWQDDLPAEDDLLAACQSGHLAITIEPEQGDRYQGIVELEAAGLAAALDKYFRDSEQLSTRVWLVADGNRAAGMLIQRLPGEDVDADAWNRVEILSRTITPAELLELSAPQIITRLFHEEDVRLFDPLPFRFQCSCSEERIGNMLRSLGADEVGEIIAEQGRVEVICEFCGLPYHFDRVDVEQLFVAAGMTAASPTRH